MSIFIGREDGTFANGTKYEKREISNIFPMWIEENCIQCNQCAFECPHAVIRPFLLDDKDVQNVPQSVQNHLLNGAGKAIKSNYKFKIQVSIQDCTGCNVCLDVCPTKEKSLVMVPYEDEKAKDEHVSADYLFNEVEYKDYMVSKETLKGSQFAKPLFEFHSACPGCGENTYISLITQLFGDRLMIANATGYSSIYASSAPYTKNDKGEGPAWANSLFEDNAEFGFGMHKANETIRNRIQTIMEKNMTKVSNPLVALFQEWIDNRNDGPKTQRLKDLLVPALENYASKDG